MSQSSEVEEVGGSAVTEESFFSSQTQPVVFLDTETTGLDPETERIFEVAIIAGEKEHVWRIEPERSVVDRMHPKALEVNRYHERTQRPEWEWGAYIGSLVEIADLIHGKHIVGAVPDFDTRFLAAEYKRAGGRVSCPQWHYHLIDVETLAVGYLYGRYGTDAGPPVEAEGAAVRLPWDSNALSAAVGVDPARFPRHQAMGDVRWAMAIYDAVTRGPR